MANYQQPPYGLPLAYAPQTPQHMQPPQQPPQQDAPGGSADRSHQAWHVPGLGNYNSYGNNGQQSQYSSAAWTPPAQFSNPWAGFPMPHFMTPGGAIPPPPIPGLSFPGTPLAQTPLPHAAPQTAFHAPAQPQQPQHQPQHQSLRNNRQSDVMDIDREDGEVSESDGVAKSPSGNQLSRPAPPSSAPRPTTHPGRDDAQEEEEYNPDFPAVEMSRQPARSIRDNDNAKMAELSRKREEARQFIRLVHSHNIGYHQLANEDVDVTQLRELYRNMNLPSEPEPIPSPVARDSSSRELVNGSAPQALAAPTNTNGKSQTKPVPAVKTSIAPAPPAASAASPVDRKDYIARLQAAKMAKQAPVSKATPPQKTPPSTAIASTPTVKTPQASTPNPRPPVTEEQRARNTELIRQRLEAIRAKNSASAAASPATKPAAASAPALAPSSSLPKKPGVPQEMGLNTTLPAKPITNVQNSQAMASPPYGIPGLFRIPSSASYNAPSQLQNSNGANLDKSSAETLDVTTGAKVMNVEDDGSKGSDMDIDDDHSSSKQPPALAPTEKQRTPQQLPSVSTLPSRPPNVMQSSSALSTPGPSTPATQSQNDSPNPPVDQLAIMKAKAKEQMQQALQQKGQSAAAPTSQMTRKRALDNASTQAGKSEQVIPAVRAASAPQTGASREAKRRRREEIESGLPALDARFADNTSQLAQMKQAIARIEAENQKIVQDKEKLVQELETLGIDTEGMEHAELQAKKDELTQIGQSKSGNDNHHSSSGMPRMDRPASETANIVEPAHLTHNISAKAPPESAIPSNIPGLGTISSSQLASRPRSAQPPAAISNDDIKRPATAQSDFVVSTSDEEHGTMTGLSAHDNRRTHSRTAATPVDDEGDFYSPEPPTSAKAFSEEGEVDMSESSEEDYEPEEPRVATTSTVPLKDTRQDAKRSSYGSTTSEDEAYEPPDVNENIPVESHLPIGATHSSNFQVEAEDGAMDISSSDESEVSSESDDSDDSESEHPGSEPKAIGHISPDQAPGQSAVFADDLAAELQPAHASPANTSANEPVDAQENVPKLPGYTPYESPLRMFKSFRYHPNYTQQVHDGFTSMTYSHQIDPQKPLCHTEAEGEICRDTQCAGQHFASMRISGDRLLVQLGTANPGKTKEEKQLWNEGLRSVLKELRQKNIKDPNGIAIEIVKFRRQFLHDDTRVINL